ncbi:MAG: hypothetical protein H7223_05955 [Pedobacter sp.]|nr:hypothetical protein [Pedobacter sp.]
MRSQLFIVLTIPLSFFISTVFACPACEKQQPKLLQGITHGAGPDGNSDYVIIACAVIIVLFTLFYSIKWLLNPGEKSDNHIKQIILNAD